MSLLPPGSRLGRFELTSVLGQGAMGVVYLASDPNIERPVAIKTLRRDVGGGAAEELESRFLKEAKLAGRLQHPNIVTIYEAGRDKDNLFIAMEYVDGRPLTHSLGPRTTLTLPQKLDIARQVAEALSHAHERGVLHRDVKPGNILLSRDGRVKVTDFGIGKLLSGASDLTRTGQMLGSPAYMSPEQVRGEKLDGRSDLFSLGVVLYEMLTGQRPFPGDSITTLVYQILHTEPRDPLSLRADLPVETREVFARLLAKSRDARPRDARAFIAEIRRIEAHHRETEPTQVVFVPPASLEPPAPPAQPDLATRPAAGPPAAAPATLAPSAPPRSFRPRPAHLFGLAALLVAVAAVIGIWRNTREGRSGIAAPAPAPTSAPPVPEGSAAAAATAPASTPAALPTPGPAAAADAVVGAPRPIRRPTEAPVERPAPAASELEPTARPAPREPTPEPEETESGGEAAREYRTRQSARFGLSPDQARLYVDGRYVGVADDWDDSGGGREFEFGRSGRHRVRVELPGYRTMHLDVVVSSSAEEDSVEIDDDLDRVSRALYTKLPSVAGRTTGAVEFLVEPPEAVVSEGGRALGPASAFGPSSPLRLEGPTVHDLLVSAPGRRPRTVRILVAPNAGRDRARVKVTLKPE
jgi:serine/threonine-protein kinase